MNNRIAAAFGVGVLLLGSTACGSNKNDGSPTGSSTSGTDSGPQSSLQGGQFPGANGKVADVNGSTAQVQSQQNGQVAVSWTGSTKFTKEVSAKLADVKVGDCVMVTPDPADSSSSSTGEDTDENKVTAGTVRIISTSGGSCSPVRGGPAGGPQLNGTPPSGGPTGAPPAGARQLRGSFGAFGKVTAVSGSGFTVSATRPSGGTSSTTTTTVTVSTTSSTKYTATAKAAASDVKVGGCMVAQGKTDSTGAITATAIALSAAVDGQCGGGFFRSDGGPGTDSGPAGTSQES